MSEETQHPCTAFIATNSGTHPWSFTQVVSRDHSSLIMETLQGKKYSEIPSKVLSKRNLHFPDFLSTENKEGKPCSGCLLLTRTFTLQNPSFGDLEVWNFLQYREWDTGPYVC